jgi:hypothetical protein
MGSGSWWFTTDVLPGGRRKARKLQLPFGAKERDTFQGTAQQRNPIRRKES